MDALNVELTPAMVAMIPVVAAILQMVKRMAFAEKIKDYLPLIAIAIAIGISYAGKMPDPIIPSVLIGLSAVGGYETLKKPKPKTP